MSCCNKTVNEADPVNAPSATDASASDRYARYPIELINHRMKAATGARRDLLNQCVVTMNESSVVLDREHPAWKLLRQTKTKKNKLRRGVSGIARSLMGVGLVNRPTRKKRRAVCDGCDQYIKKMDMCNACGCNVTLKLRLAKERCPVDKW
jgi:hypothetical protein